MTCPPTLPGTVTNQSGTVSGSTPTYSDAFWDRPFGITETPPYNSQWQGLVDLTDHPVACAHYRANEEVKGALRLVFGLGAGRLDSGPLPFPPPGTYPVVTTTEAPPGSGNQYQWQVTFVQHSTKNCNHTEKAATSGTVTVASMDDLQASGSYDLVFGSSGSLAGTFVAPRCGVAGSFGVDGCPARAPTTTCIS